jgi:hypothetical protein
MLSTTSIERTRVTSALPYSVTLAQRRVKAAPG